jgi:hypothetical protein
MNIFTSEMHEIMIGALEEGPQYEQNIARVHGVYCTPTPRDRGPLLVWIGVVTISGLSAFDAKGDLFNAK